MLCEVLVKCSVKEHSIFSGEGRRRSFTFGAVGQLLAICANGILYNNSANAILEYIIMISQRNQKLFWTQIQRGPLDVLQFLKITQILCNYKYMYM